MPLWSTLVVIVFTNNLPHVWMYNKTCFLPPKAQGEPYRPVVSGQFTVEVEATFRDRNVTSWIREVFDYPNNRGRLTVVGDGQVTDYYYDYNDNQMLVVTPKNYSCKVQTLATAGFAFVLGDDNGHIFSPAQALRLGGQAGVSEVYVGRRVVRGVRVNQWESCQDWPQRNASMHVAWAFVDNMRWVAPAAVVNVPVFCHVTGKVWADDTHFRTFEHDYNFIHFVDNIPPASERVFETPRGVVCPGRKNTMRMPTLPATLALTGETVIQKKKDVTYSQERYDSTGKIVTYSFRGDTDLSNKYGPSPLTVINDFGTGTQYVVDVERGNCTVTSLAEAQTPDVIRNSDMMSLRLQGARHLLGMEANFTYSGQRTIRSIPCDVWVARKTAFDMMGITLNATFEWAFSTESWSYEHQGGGSSVPVQVVYTLDDFSTRQTAVTNIYDFTSTGVDVLQGVDIGACFIGAPRNLVVFSISRDYTELLQYFQTEFRHAVRQSVATSIGVSSLRIANVQYRLQQFTLDVSLDLLPPPSTEQQASSSTSKEPDLDTATHALTDAVTGNRMVITVETGAEQPSFVVADPHSLRISRLNQARVVTGRQTPPLTPPMTPPLTPPTPGVTPTPFPAPFLSTAGGPSEDAALCRQYAGHQTGYTSGVMAGAGLAMAVVGAALGCVTHRLIVRTVT